MRQIVLILSYNTVIDPNFTRPVSGCSCLHGKMISSFLLAGLEDDSSRSWKRREEDELAALVGPRPPATEEKLLRP